MRSDKSVESLMQDINTMYYAAWAFYGVVVVGIPVIAYLLKSILGELKTANRQRNLAKWRDVAELKTAKG